jgi:hypothetical protein
MAKTNFTKVEKIFEDEKAKQMRDDLLKEADRVSGKASPENPVIEAQKKHASERKILIQALTHHLKEHDETTFELKIGFSKDLLEELLKKGLSLTDEEYTLLVKMKKKIDRYKKNHENYDEKLVEQERKKHINKRFNVRDKWLPLK